jgi:uncharacterized protein
MKRQETKGRASLSAREWFDAKPRRSRTSSNWIGVVLVCALVVVQCGRVRGDRHEERPANEIDRSREAKAFLASRGLGGSDGTVGLFWEETIKNPHLLARFLDSGVSPGVRGPEGLTLLMVAVRQDHLGLRDRLIAEGTTINAQDDEGTTALMWAAIRRRPESSRRLLNAGADPDIKSKHGWTALMYAAASGDMASVDLLMQWRAQALVVNEDKLSARDIARRRRFNAIANKLPAGAAAPEVSELRLGTSLTTQPAIAFGVVPDPAHAESTIQFRLDSGAAPQRIGLSVGRPFRVVPAQLTVTTLGPHAATISIDATALPDLLRGSLEISHASGTTSVPITATVIHGVAPDIERVSAPCRRLLDSPGNRESKVEFLQAALQMAAGVGDVPSVRALLDCGISPDFVFQGETPLTLAAKGNRILAVMTLLEGGADVHLKGTKSALEYAKLHSGNHLQLLLQRAGERE